MDILTAMEKHPQLLASQASAKCMSGPMLRVPGQLVSRRREKVWEILDGNTDVGTPAAFDIFE